MSNLIQELSERARVLTGSESVSTEQVDRVILELINENLISRDTNSSGTVSVSLTKAGTEFVVDKSAESQRLYDQFFSSLNYRAASLLSPDNGSAANVANAAENFLKDCIEKRALGVAMALSAWRAELQEYQMVALLQSLPAFMSQLKNSDEALALTKLIQGVLAQPTEAESVYMGLSLQAQFGVHILGYNVDTFRARTRELFETAFILDATTLIPLLAKSSVGHNAASLLVRRLQSIGSSMATTEFLSEEVAEHARYAIRKAGEGLIFNNIELLKSATGRQGERSNAFLEGFFEEVSAGIIPPDFSRYIGEICESCKGGSHLTDKDIKTALNRWEVASPTFSEWEGFYDELWAERDEKEGEIAFRRKERGSYKHDRQVRAEAEALLIVQNLRNGKLKIHGRSVTNAYFVSPTRIIDEVAGAALPITMRPESILQWLATLTQCDLTELSYLTDTLLLELSLRGFNVIDKSQIQTAFSPLISASKEKLNEEVERHRALIATMYGENAEQAFKEVPDADVPIVLESFYAQRAEALAQRVDVERKLREEAQARARLTERDKEALARYRADEVRRKNQARRNRRKNEGRNQKKRKRRN